MSVAFAATGPEPPMTPAEFQNKIEENDHLLQTIKEYQEKTQILDCHQYIQALHKKLISLAALWFWFIDNPIENIQTILPVEYRQISIKYRQQIVVLRSTFKTIYSETPQEQRDCEEGMNLFQKMGAMTVFLNMYKPFIPEVDNRRG